MFLADVSVKEMQLYKEVVSASVAQFLMTVLLTSESTL
jgi:hypothetical protein